MTWIDERYRPGSREASADLPSHRNDGVEGDETVEDTSPDTTGGDAIEDAAR